MKKLLVDSSCDIPREYLEKYDIEMLKIPAISADGNEVDSLSEMYELQRELKFFTTSQISQYTYQQSFERYLQRGIDIVYICLSSGLSGCYQNALMAREELLKKYPDRRVEVMDSLSASVGAGLFAIAICRNLEKPMDELLELGEFLRKNVKHIFAVTDLKYLYAGGRVSKLKMNMSKLMQFFPVLCVDESGKIFVKEVVRGKNKLYKKMLSIAEFSDRRYFLGVYGEDDEQFSEFFKLIDEQFEVFEKTRMQMTITAHIGPDIIGGAYFEKPLPKEWSWID